MRTEELRQPAVAWAVLGLLLTSCLLAVAVPASRPALALGMPWVAGGLVLAGARLHRPAGRRLWCLVALMLALYGVGEASAQAGVPAVAADALVGGQVVAGVLLLVVGRWSRDRRRRVDLLELAVVGSVLGLAAAQVAVLLASDEPAARQGLVASSDVVLLAFALRFSLAHRSARPAWWFLLAAVTALVGYDLMTVGQVGRTSSGDGTAVLLLGLGLFAVAALHPSMRGVLDRRELSAGRPHSADLLGLLPLVAVPVGLRLVDLAAGGAGLPGWTYLVAGTSTAAAGVLRAWTALRRSEHQAEHDPLTDLPNRRGLTRVFEQTRHAGGRALLLVDLDEFKDVNDAHGHDVGDRLLLGVRDRLLAAAGPDAVVARFGGDEFAVLVHPGREDDVAERLVSSLRRPLAVQGLVLRTSASVGLAPPEPGASLSEQLTRADVALYAAKGAGRDTVRSYRPEQRAEVQRRFALTTQVRQLLGGRSAAVGRLEMHYQPLVELATGEVVGAEALVRWRHPEHGLMPPDAFLGHVSSSGLDVELDTAVLQEVLEQMGRWRDQRRRALPVSVNLTRASLLDPALLDRVRELLARAGVPGSQLHVEILEHEPLPDDDRLLATLHGLRAIGVDIHLDDYGTGYTSLDYLRRFPVQVLKVDRSVVAAGGSGGAQLVAGIGAMSRTLRLDLLAEGVETEQQRRRLLAQGVRLGQGWLFSHPLPAPVYAERVLGRPHECLPATGVPAPRLPLTVPADVAV